MVRQHPEFELHGINDSLKKRNIPGRRGFNIKDFKINGNVSFHEQQGVHRSLGLYLYKVGSLGQVVGSSVMTSSCLLDLTQRLLKDPTDATETSVLVWTGQRVQKVAEGCGVYVDLRLTLAVLCTASSSANQRWLLLLTQPNMLNWGSAWSSQQQWRRVPEYVL